MNAQNERELPCEGKGSAIMWGTADNRSGIMNTGMHAAVVL